MAVSHKGVGKGGNSYSSGIGESLARVGKKWRREQRFFLVLIHKKMCVSDKKGQGHPKISGHVEDGRWGTIESMKNVLFMKEELVKSVNLIVRGLVKLGRNAKEEWRLQCLKAQQRWKGTTDCSQGLGRMWWVRNVTSDKTLSLQKTCSLSMWPRSALVWPSTLQHGSFPQYWSGRSFPFVIPSVKAETLSSPGSILSEHEPTLSVHA